MYLYTRHGEEWDQDFGEAWMLLFVARSPGRRSFFNRCPQLEQLLFYLDLRLCSHSHTEI